MAAILKQLQRLCSVGDINNLNNIQADGTLL